MVDKKKVRYLLEKRDDEEALEKLAAMGKEIVPMVIKAFTKLEPYAEWWAEWYLRILDKIEEDPVEELVRMLEKVQYRMAVPVGYALLRNVKPDHASFLREQLALNVSFARGGKYNKLPARFGDYHLAPKATMLALALGRLGDRESIPIIEHLYKAASKELAATKRQFPNGYDAFYLNHAPAIAASAASLLGLSELLNLDNEKDREKWRRSCVEIGLDLAIQYGCTYIDPPMPFMLVNAPAEASRIVVMLFDASEEKDKTLERLGRWIDLAHNSNISVAFDPAVEGMEKIKEDLIAGIDAAIDFLPLHDTGMTPGLEILKTLEPQAVDPRVMELLKSAPVGTRALEDTVDQLKKAKPFTDIAAIAVEAFMGNRYTRDFIEIKREELNKELKRNKMSRMEDWAWKAPAGDFSNADTPENLNSLLCYVINTFEDMKRGITGEGLDAFLELVKPYFYHTLVRHAIFRNLFLLLKTVNATIRKSLIKHFPDLKDEYDVTMIKSMVLMAGEILGDKGNFVYPLMLQSHAVLFDIKLAIHVLDKIKVSSLPEGLKKVREFKSAFDFKRENKQDVYNLKQLLDEVLMKSGDDEAIDNLVEKMNNNRYVSNEEQLTLLRLVWKNSITVEPQLFNRVFGEIISRGYGVYSGWTEVILGDQAREYIVERLRNPDLKDEELKNIAEYLFWSSRAQLPPEAFGLLLKRLPKAVQDAIRYPGEEFETRDWSGYTFSESEELADKISSALKVLAEKQYDEKGWKTFLAELLPVMKQLNVDLTKMRIADSSCCGIEYPDINFFSKMRNGLFNLKNPAVREILSSPDNILEALIKTEKLLL